MGSHAGKEDETCAKAHDFQEISMFIDEKQLEKHMCRKCLHLIVSISEGFHDLSSFSTSTKSENIRKDKIEFENDPGPIPMCCNANGSKRESSYSSTSCKYIKKSEKKRRIGSPEKEKCVGGIRREGENTDSFKKVFLSEGRSEHACARCNAGSLTELISVKFTKLRVLRTE